MRMTMPLAACLAAALTACAKDEPPPSQALVPPSLLVGCAAPVDLPQRDLTGTEVEVLWGRDRSALRACGSQVSAISETLGASEKLQP